MSLPLQPHEKLWTRSGGHVSKRWFWPAVILVLVTGGATILQANRSLSDQASPPTVIEEPIRAMQLHPLELLTVQFQPLEEVVKVTGTIKPLQEATLSAQIDGVAETVSVHPGDVVEEGQLLVGVGTADLQLHLEQQRSTMESTAVQLRAARASLDRTRLLAAKGLAAQSSLEAAQLSVDDLVAAIESRQSEVALAKANLDRARILAPFSGTISQRSVEPGQVVGPGTALLTLVDTSTVRVDVVAALRDSTSIRVGQTVRLDVTGLPHRSITGAVDRVNPVAEAGTRSIKIYLTLANAEGLLRGGMFVTGEIVVRAEASALVVPATAIRLRAGSNYVLLIENDQVFERRVETGAEWEAGGLVEVRSGLSAGDVIVNTALEGLVDGTPVTVTGA